MKKHPTGNFDLAWRLSFVFATALLLLAGPPRGRRALIPIPEPANEILKLEYILNVWRCQNMVEMEDLDWFSNISDDERQALRQASGPAMRSQAKVASELLHQAYLLHQEPESQIVADKLFVLAARAHRDLCLLRPAGRGSSMSAAALAVGNRCVFALVKCPAR